MVEINWNTGSQTWTVPITEKELAKDDMLKIENIKTNGSHEFRLNGVNYTEQLEGYERYFSDCTCYYTFTEDTAGTYKFDKVDTKVYARRKYAITYLDENMNSYGADAVDAKYMNAYHFDSDFGEFSLPILEKKDMIFGGWFKDSKYTDGPYKIAKITSDTTFYAKWDKKAVPKDDSKEEPKKDSKENPKNPTKFKDVNYDSWMGKSINYVSMHGYMKGVGDGTNFAPNDSCTREMFVQILYNVFGEPAVEGECTFTDAKAGWYYKALTWGQQKGITNGKADGSFGVNEKVTRQELAQFFYNYSKHCGYKMADGADISNFPDCGEVSGWALNSVKWANASGVINGKGKDGVKYLDPKGLATRAEVAQMVMNLMENVAK